MHSIRLAFFAALLCPAVAIAQQDSLHVLRVSGGDTVHYRTPITVTFDRPIAMSVESLPDPWTVLQIAPRVPGRLKWRSPVSLRFVPDSEWGSGTNYQITLAANTHAIDGTTLGVSYVHRFNGAGPRLVAVPKASHDSVYEAWVSVRHPMLVAYDAAVDSAMLVRDAFMEIESSCGIRSSRISVRVSGRRWRNGDPWNYSRVGQGWSPRTDRSYTYSIVPAVVLPPDCAGTVVIPTSFTGKIVGPVRRIPFRTYPRLAVSKVSCVSSVKQCPSGPFTVTFSAPVSRDTLLRYLHATPADSVGVVAESYQVSGPLSWIVTGAFRPRTQYLFSLDAKAHDDDGLEAASNVVMYMSEPYNTEVLYTTGQFVLQPNGRAILPVRYVNTASLLVTVTPFADTVRETVLRYLERQNNSEKYDIKTLACATPLTRTFFVPKSPDRFSLTEVSFPLPSGACGGRLFAVDVRPTLDDPWDQPPIVLVQRTMLGADARVSERDAVVLVTNLASKAPVSHAQVRIAGEHGDVLVATTGKDGIARFAGDSMLLPHEETGDIPIFSARVGSEDVIGVWPRTTDLSHSRVRLTTDRDIYRPGDTVRAVAILRDGMLDQLRLPTVDSVTWVMQKNGEDIAEGRTAVTAFGTASWSVALPAQGALGYYNVSLSTQPYFASQFVQVEEYRAPAFLIHVTPGAPSFVNGDTAHVDVAARYLFDAPVALAPAQWSLRFTPAAPPTLASLKGYSVGDTRWYWSSWGNGANGDTSLSGTITLDRRGVGRVSVSLPSNMGGVAHTATIETDVTDPTQQHIANRVTFPVHPATIYVGIRMRDAGVWQAGTSRDVDVLAAGLNDMLVAGTPVDILLLRRSRTELFTDTDSARSVVHEDTAARCHVMTARTPVGCALRPDSAGYYWIRAGARDARGRETVTWQSVYVVPGVQTMSAQRDPLSIKVESRTYSVGDTVHVFIESPVKTTALLGVEGEHVLSAQPVAVHQGTTVVSIVVNSRMIPEANISVTSRDSAGVSHMDRTTITVSTAVKRASVAVVVPPREVRPGQTVDLAVRTEANGTGKIGSTLWAVDEGVLSLTDFVTPDPLAEMYEPRGSWLSRVSTPGELPRDAPLATTETRIRLFGYRVVQVQNNISIAPAPSVLSGVVTTNTGAGPANPVRNRFATTPFFLGSIAADGQGIAHARVTFPDNLTTFRVMAMSTVGADRFGAGASSLLVSKPLLARPALPRFVRPGDIFTAGPVVTSRVGTLSGVQVSASTQPALLRGDTLQTVTASDGGTPVRFAYHIPRADSLHFRYAVHADTLSDAVDVSIPVHADYLPRAHVMAGAVRDSGTVVFTLPAETDPARTALVVNIGRSPLGALSAARGVFLRYSYNCTEQSASLIRALTVLRVHGDSTAAVEHRITRAIEDIVRRQRADGAFKYWDDVDWTNSWLTAYAGTALLDAKQAGFSVDQSVIDRAAEYVLANASPPSVERIVGVRRVDPRVDADLLGNMVASLDFLQRAGRNTDSLMTTLVRHRELLQWADRVWLATIVVRANPQDTLARHIIREAAGLLRVEGNRVTLPDSTAGMWAFPSFVQSYTRLLDALTVAEPKHPMIFPLIETVMRGGTATELCNTFDWSQAVVSVDAATTVTGALSRTQDVRVTSGNTVVWDGRHAPTDSMIVLGNLLERSGTGTTVPLHIQGNGRVYYVLTVFEVPTRQPIRPDNKGLFVERRYERVSDGKTVTSVRAGELVRVHLKVTVPRARQFVVLDDPLPAGLEVVDPSLHTTASMPIRPSEHSDSVDDDPDTDEVSDAGAWTTGRWIWDGHGYAWTVWEHRELRDDRVIFSARRLWNGSYTASYLARATTSGTFIRPTTQAEEMYNPALHGRSDGGTFVVEDASSH